MDPQQPNPPHPPPNTLSQHLHPDKIISMMRITKKTDRLFKPLKKLKNALDSIGYDKISLKPTPIIIIFHFGLGNDLDLQFIKQTNLPLQIIKNNNDIIIPGKSYCYVNFISQQQSSQYYNSNYMPILQDIGNVGYKYIQYQKLSRIFICMYINTNINTNTKTNTSNNTYINNNQQSITYNTQSISIQQLNIQNTQLYYIPQSIPGIILIQQFITNQEQIQLLTAIDKGQWNKLNNRRVQHYGYQFKYGKNGVDKQQKYQIYMPQFIRPILDKLKKLQIIPNTYVQFDQMTINDYFSGDGIPSHFDTHSPFQQYFIAISMLSGIVMNWRRYDGIQKYIYLPARSLIIFSGEGRYAWTHGISCRKFDKIQGKLKYRSRRISITLRKIKYTPCLCKYYFYCDSQGYDQNTMKKNNPLLIKYLAENVKKKKLENINQDQIYKKYVLEAYNGFGFDFHNKAIPAVEKLVGEYFKEKIEKNKKQTQHNLTQTINILDVGCGNGQYKDLLQQKFTNNNKIFYQYFGIQICQTMKNFEDKIHMDGLSLSFRQKSFDLVLSIAVLHHMTKYQQRLKMLQQIYKVLTDQGILILTVFGYEQKSNIYKDQDILLQYCVPQHKINNNNNKMEEIYQNQENLTVRKQKRGKIYQRYYHLFKLDEIRQLMKNAKFQILYEEVDKENIIIKAQKIQKQ